MRSKTLFSIAYTLLFAGSLPVLSFAEERIRLVDLRGQWLFKTGDNTEWKTPELDDSNWATIFAPSSWEDEGFPGYDGYAWYRIHVKGQEKFNQMSLSLDLGRIDDCDQVWVNGKMIGATGGFPPQYFTAFNRNRVYNVPAGIFTEGENVIAIRVYDEKFVGGILEGKLGIYGTPLSAFTSLDLSGIWKLKTGDESIWKNPDFDDADWQDVMVPMFWDAQGLARYDGTAWYRKEFIWSGNESDKLYLKLGLIDDFDEVFLNGYRVGGTGTFPQEGEWPEFNDEYKMQRVYTIPADLLRSGRNVLSVRVFDGGHDGGIYDGPVCLTTESTQNVESNWEEGEPAPEKSWFSQLISAFVNWLRNLFR